MKSLYSYAMVLVACLVFIIGATVPDPRTGSAEEITPIPSEPPTPSTTQLPTSCPDDSNWSEGFYYPGSSPIGTWVLFMSAVDDRLYLSGDISIMGNVRTRGIVAWDGDRFIALDTGLNYMALDVVSWRGRHIATGGFPYLASWDGSRWTSLPVGRSTYRLCVFDSRLIAAVTPVSTSDSLQYIAAYNDTAWHPLGSGLNNGVGAMVVFDNRLIVGGSFTQADGRPATHIAAWNGSSWSPLAAGLPATVTSLAIVGSRLVATGPFDPTAKGDDIAVWEESTGWEIHRTTTPYQIRQTVVLNDTLFAVINHRAAYFDGADWTYLIDPAFAKGSVEAIDVFRGDLVIGGRFVSERARFEWTTVVRENGSFNLLSGNGVGQPNGLESIYGLVELHDRLIALGGFEAAGGAESDGAAFGDGTCWRNIGYRGASQAFNPVVIDERLYAVIGTDYRARSWNGVKWLDLPGLPWGPPRLVAFRNELCAVADGGLYRWTGAVWNQLAADIPDPNLSGAVTVWNDMIVIAGGFTSVAGFPARGIAAWDGSSWHSFGSGFDNPVEFYSLFTYAGDLWVSGIFSKVGGIPANGLARWDGSQWHSAGSGLTTETEWPMINGATTFHGQLVVVGRFDSIDGVPARNIAIYNGHTWRALGSGIQGFPITVKEYRGSLYVGGSFTYAGDKISINFAKWGPELDELDSVIYLPKPDEPLATPADFFLNQNFPNPFNLSTEIAFTLPAADHVSLVVYNALGQRVRTLVDEPLPAGDHFVTWDGYSDRGSIAASGIYFYLIETGSQSLSRKMALVK